MLCTSPHQSIPSHSATSVFDELFLLSQDAYVANRANIYLRMEKWKEAEADGSKSIEMGNESSRKHDRRGQARYNLGNFDGALEDFIQTKALDPNTKSVDQNIEYCKERIKRRQIDKERKEMDPKKAKGVAADEGAVLERKSEQHSIWSDSEEERNISVKNDKINEKAGNIDISPPNSGQSKNEKTDEELRLEIEADKEELERRLQAKLDQKAKEEMIELIREKILEEERLKLVQEKLALRDMVERYEDEEKRKNCEIQDQGTDPESGIEATSSYCEVFL